MKSKTLTDVVSWTKKSNVGVIKLLLADHKLLRSYMEKVKSQRATDAQKIAAFKFLEKCVRSHVKAEENALLTLIDDHPKFKDMVAESYEEHRVHEYVLDGIKQVRDKKRKIQQMGAFCEILEHHLDEEEDDLFPRFKKNTASSTRRKIGHKFLEIREKTKKTSKRVGATRFKS